MSPSWRINYIQVKRIILVLHPCMLFRLRLENEPPQISFFAWLIRPLTIFGYLISANDANWFQFWKFFNYLFFFFFFFLFGKPSPRYFLPSNKLHRLSLQCDLSNNIMFAEAVLNCWGPRDGAYVEESYWRCLTCKCTTWDGLLESNYRVQIARIVGIWFLLETGESIIPFTYNVLALGSKRIVQYPSEQLHSTA